MLIILVIGLKENQPVETVNFLVRIWYPGLARDKQLLLCLQQKHNISQLQVVVHNYFGWNISKKTIRLMLTVFPFIVIILLLFVCQRIQFYIQGQSILKSNTTLLEIMFKKEYLMEKVVYEWMHVCMIMLKNMEYMVRLSP